jgi:hypothetical protein
VSNARNQELRPVATTKCVDPYAMINEGQALLKEGDLVVRLNGDPTSQYIRNFNRSDKRYSHAGILLFENGHPYVYHIVNGEESPNGKMRKVSLSRFCDPRKNIAFGIFRYKLAASETKSLKNLVLKWYAKGVRFDSTFNLATDDRMYCSEMIGKALAKVTDKKILIETTKLTTTEAKLFSVYAHLPFSYTSKLRIVSIDNLYKNPACYLIKEYNYKTSN